MSESRLEFDFLMRLKAARLPTPEREYRFFPDRRWRFDFAWPDRKVACEIEGGIWVNGGHVRGKIYIKNCEKYNTATKLGWKVFRYTPELFGNIEEDLRDLLA